MSNSKKSSEPKFPKESLLNSERYRDKRDIVSALLEDGVEYTFSEVENIITKYMKGKVK